MEEKEAIFNIRHVYHAFLLLRCALSPSASQLLALINCTTLTNCLKAMTGKDTAVIAHGTRLSILLALANSNALALHGLVKRPANVVIAATDDGLLLATGCRRDGINVGDEKERRYRPMKKSSLRAQQIKRTVCEKERERVRRDNNAIVQRPLCAPTLL